MYIVEASKNPIIINECYRYTYDGEGIYEAFRKAVPDKVWKEFLNSTAAKWLPKPKYYGKYNRSYFTPKGKIKFEKYTLPIFEKYLNKAKIKLEKVTIDNPAYQDKYQIITSESY